MFLRVQGFNGIAEPEGVNSFSEGLLVDMETKAYKGTRQKLYQHQIVLSIYWKLKKMLMLQGGYIKRVKSKLSEILSFAHNCWFVLLMASCVS